MIDENVMIAVSNLATKIKKLVSDHAAIKGNGSTFGHVKASDSSLIRPIGDSLEVGTDNNQYARADHVHTVTYSNIKNPPYIPSKTSDLTNDSGFLTEHQDISGKVNIAQGSSKANMNVVTNASGNITTEAKPFIPSKTSDLTNDSGYLTQHQDISGKEDKTNKTSSWNSTTNNTRYPTEKLVKDSLNTKENSSNKTSSWNSTTNNTRYPTEKLVKDSLDGKSNIDHSHPNATSSSNGLMSSDDKAKLDGISSGANAYTHPSYTARTGKPTGNQTPAFGGTATVSQITSDSTGHVTGATDRTIKIPNTEASTTEAGLMSTDDKTKLNGIETSANNYTHPSYTAKTGKPTANQTPAFGGTATVSQITSDSTGHVTGTTDRTIKIPNTLANGTTAGLSTNDYTTTEKTKLSGIATGATKNTVSNSLSDTSTTNALSAAKGADLQEQINNIVTGETATDHNHDNLYSVSLAKLDTPTSGYIATYEVTQGSTSLGKIDIPKDYLVKSGSVKSVTTANNPVSGYAVGDKYIDFVINTKDNSGTDEHIYINVKDLIDVYTHPNSGVTAGTNYNGNQTPAFGATFNIPKLTFNAQGHITASANSTVKIPNTLGNGTTAGLSTNDYTTTEKTKLSGIEEEANKYTHPTGTAKTGNPTANQTPAFGSTFKVTQFTSNSTGHISGATDRTIKIPNTLGDGTTAGLSTNDYTTTEKTKLSGIATGATKNTVENSLSSDSTTNALSAAQGKELKTAIDGKSTVSYTQTGTGTVEIGKINIDGTEIAIKQRDNNTTYTKAANTPPADTTNGTVGTVNKYALEDHSHPKSSLYAEASHTHTKSQITDFPTSMTPTSHTHGNITNAGAIGSTANLPIITTTSGKLTTGSFGTAANTFCQGNDSRLSNTRTPTFNLIPASSSNIEDLDNYKTGGFYYVDSDSGKSRYVIHCPNSDGTATPYTGNKSFFLLVETWGTTSTYVKQTITYYNDNTTYTRTCANNAWGAWKRLDIDTNTTYGADRGISNVSGKFGHSNTAITAQTTSALKKIKYDTYGHITGTDSVSSSDLPSHTHTKSQITDFPTIPSKTSQLTNDSGFLTSYTPPTGSTSQAGIVKLNTSTSSTSTTEAATPSAVKSAYDLANGKPSLGTTASTAAKGNHTHGNITNAGAIGSTANKPIITTTSGKLTTGSFGTTANTFCEGDDSRLSDARTPLAHTHKGWDSKSSSNNWQLYVNSDLRLAFFRYDAGVPGDLSNNATFDILTSGATVTNSPLHGTSFTTQNPYLSAWITAEGYVQVWTSDKSKFSKLVFSGFYLTAA